MDHQHKTPEEKRERLRQEELKRNPTGAVNDGLNRATTGNLADVVGGLGLKGIGLLIVGLIIGYVLYKVFT